MKASDIIGFWAILVAGYYWGVHSAGTFTPQDLFTSGNNWVDWLIVFGLLAVGFYFAVVLS